MPFTLEDGSFGLLAHGKVGEAVLSLPEYDVSHIEDELLLNCLFRDLSILSEAYLLEDCHLRYLETGEYGLAKDRLPRQIAVPLWVVSRKLKANPWMNYHQGLVLMNYKKKDVSMPLTFDNVKMIRQLNGCAAESGFILCHVAINAYSPALVQCISNIH